MFFAAATVLDTLPHVRRLVAGNLAGGLDHLVVFLDHPGADGQHDVAAFLDEHPHVTCVRAGRGWWNGARPRELDDRQGTNANAVKQVVAGLTGARDHWVLPVDGDEVVRLDPDAVRAVPSDVDVVRLQPRAAASRWEWPGEPTLFKRELDEPDLVLLHRLGVIGEPTNAAYFHGAPRRRSAVRASAPAHLTPHGAVGPGGGELPTHDDQRLELFGYASGSGEELVRRWATSAVPHPRTGRALRALVGKNLPPETTEKYLRRFYERTERDDVDTLLDLGLLLETDPLAGHRVPAPAPAGLLEGLAAGLDELRPQRKDHLLAPRSR